MAASSTPSLVGTIYTEEEFVRAFEDLSFPGEQFHHREHVHLAWLYLQQGNTEKAAALMAESVRRFATFHEAERKYHVTLTYAWVRLIAAAKRRSPELSFFAFLAENPELLDSRLPYLFFSQALLDSEQARTGLVDPDLAPIP